MSEERVQISMVKRKETDRKVVYSAPREYAVEALYVRKEDAERLGDRIKITLEKDED